METKHQLTISGLEELKNRLKKLKDVDRPRNIEALKEARAQGDLSDNAEYDAAREEQAQIENEISILEDVIKNAVTIDEMIHSSNIGKRITVFYSDDDETEEFLLVGSSLEADPMQGKVSKDSPLGKAVLYADVDSEVTVKPESGNEFNVKIIGVR